MGLFILGFFLPLGWIVRIWLEDRLVPAWMACAAIVAHISIFLVLMLYREYNLTIPVAVYCGLVLGAIALCPYFGMAHDLITTRRFVDDDISRCQRVLQRDPNNAAAHAALGDAYVSCERYDEAIAAYDQAIALDPDHSYRENWKREEAHNARRLQEQRAEHARRLRVFMRPKPPSPPCEHSPIPCDSDRTTGAKPS